MVQKFLDHLKYEKRYSEHTIASYQTDLSQLNDFLVNSYDGISIEESSHSILRSWVVNLVDSNMSAKTINRKISAVKSYFKWGIKFASFQSDPTQKIILPKISKRLPVYIEESQMDSLLTNEVFPNSYEGQRDKLIIDLFYQTGVRCSELINILDSDVDFSSTQLKVLGKRKKERIIPLGTDLLNKIREFQELKLSFFDHSTDANLFITSKGVKLYPKLVYRVVNNYLGEVSAIKRKSACAASYIRYPHAWKRC